MSLKNAFSEKLSPFGFNLYVMLVVDLLHEFELGVWKAIFTHLLRILHAFGNDTLQELNRRYVQPYETCLRLITKSRIDTDRYRHSAEIQFGSSTTTCRA